MCWNMHYVETKLSVMTIDSGPEVDVRMSG